MSLSDLNNELIGDDFATFVISEKSPSPALPARGRESDLAAATQGGGSQSRSERRSKDCLRRSSRRKVTCSYEMASSMRPKTRPSIFDQSGRRPANEVKSAEEFIDKIATKSSLSGEAYRVRRADGTEVLASDYLREKLSGIENRQNRLSNDRRWPI